jgi:hypothetical protein
MSLVRKEGANPHSIDFNRSHNVRDVVEELDRIPWLRYFGWQEEMRIIRERVVITFNPDGSAQQRTRVVFQAEAHNLLGGNPLVMCVPFLADELDL